ncbi:acyl--CoA ligase [Sphingobium sp. AR-3-1]|uniref:Acyl--CoA ligase n=1 Tax=Sphingobium psychrophilum TaxID=2728834 RepID=A0A7X9WT47_9SPHN|nr:class I adenylate-forming enzyme family protein [Sphingobium psychrophilum]NML09333.1 acyl--CoA ligase [Sphingobium psychrophilum]
MGIKGEDSAAIRITATTLGDLLLKGRDKGRTKDALVFPGERKSYDDLVAGVLRRARGLKALGIGRGDHVGILLPSSIEFVETLFANAMCGAVSVLMNARYKAPEMAYVAQNADLRAIVTNDLVTEHVDFGAQLVEAFSGLPTVADPAALTLAEAPLLRQIIMLGGRSAPGFVDQARFDAAVQSVSESDIHDTRLTVRVRDTAMILYTSGTSANPKGCLLSHEAVTREANNLARYRWGFQPDERAWSPLPLFHIAAMLCMLGAMDVGGTFIGQPHFDAGESLRQIEAEQVTMMFLPFVTFHQAMIAHPEWEKTDMSSVRLQNSCFAFMPDRVGQAYRDKAPNMLQVGTMGMTEATGIVTTGGPAMDPEMGFRKLGYPLAGIEMKIVDPDTGVERGVDERGEILIRGYNLFDGYYRDAEKTAEAIDADGWYHSADIGSIDAEGHMMFHGRFKDMLKVGGENVAAAEVEAVLASHPAVRLAQVVGLPDDRLAEIPAAYIERDGDVAVEPDELIAYTKARLASFKVPRHIRFIDEWPMSASKIQKFKLRAALMAELGLSD